MDVNIPLSLNYLPRVKMRGTNTALFLLLDPINADWGKNKPLLHFRDVQAKTVSDLSDAGQPLFLISSPDVPPQG